MKSIRFIWVYCLCIGFYSLCLCQEIFPEAPIGVTARYNYGSIELRWFPGNANVLQLGLASGYTVYCKASRDSEFREITVIKPFNEIKWDSLIAQSVNSEMTNKLEMLKDLIFGKKIVDPGLLNLDKGIGQLKNRKDNEDMLHTIFVLCAVQDSVLAYALGLGFRDAEVKKETEYEYIVKCNASSPVMRIKEGVCKIKAIETLSPEYPQVFVYPGDTRISFTWSSTHLLSGYFTERYDPNKGKFIALNSIPYYASVDVGYNGPSQVTFDEDSLTNYTLYTYRFYGLNPFGEKVLFAEVKGMPRDLTPPDNPIIKQPQHISPREVRIDWEMHGNLQDLKGFAIGHSNRDTGLFKLVHPILLPPPSRRYIDTTFVSGALNYYMVYAIDTAGNISASFPAYVALIDSIPPAKPKISSAIIDSLGVVTLMVEKGAEPDLKGYKVYMANSPEHEFSVIEEAYKADSQDSVPIKLVFTDTVTLQSLTPTICYRVKALDFNYNHSVFSDIAEVKRPDTIPPVTPLFTDVIVGEKYIELHVACSESEDVAYHVLYRKIDLEDDWQVLLKVDTTFSLFSDTNVQTGVTYYYSLQAVDQNALQSGYANPVSGKPYDSGIRPPIQSLMGFMEDGKARLTWDYPAIKDKEVIFVIYKRDSKGRLVQYSSTSEHTLLDQNTERENDYAIKAITTDGGKSNLSEIVQIRPNEGE